MLTALWLMVSGMAFVFAVLGILLGVVALLNRLFKLPAKEPR